MFVLALPYMVQELILLRLRIFSENPNGKLVLKLIDNKGGSGEISIKMGDDNKLVLSLDIENLGYHLH